MAKARNTSGANLGFEDRLWEAADKLRGHMDASEYKHVVLGLIFLKYISDRFERKRRELDAFYANEENEFYIADPEERYRALEERDEYDAEHVFWVPQKARWDELLAKARAPAIGKLVDNAMLSVETENLTLKGVLPRTYARPSLDKRRLGELLDVVGKVGFGDYTDGSQDVLGRVYEYFLGRFAAAEGKSGGEFYTPQCVVRVLVEMIEPFRGRVFDPCCGSGGMFVQSERFVRAHGGRAGDIAVYGQESNPTTWRLCSMNLAIRGIEANLGGRHADSFHDDVHKDLRADYILANPPFNMSDWGGERLRDDARWKYGTPPAGNANYAWIQHFIHHLAPGGVAGFVMANGSLSSNQSGEGDIRRAIVEADLVDCVIAMPTQLFYTTGIPVCLWFVARSKKDGSLRDRRGQMLFIDARRMGTMVDRTHRELDDEDVARIAGTYHAWRGEAEAGEYADVPGFCRHATLDDIREHGHVLTPGRYVGAPETEDDGEPFEEKMPRLVARLYEQFSESRRLEKAIRENLEGLGYGQ
jgi:type I restriction enzyme M protein